MKTILIICSCLLVSACATNQQVAVQQAAEDLALNEENGKLCENHKKDFQHFRLAFDKEHAEVCGSGCTYTDSMIKNSDTMERVAGLYYLMDCDANYGRL